MASLGISAMEKCIQAYAVLQATAATYYREYGPFIFCVDSLKEDAEYTLINVETVVSEPQKPVSSADISAFVLLVKWD